MRSKMVQLVLVSGVVVVGAGVLLGCGPEPATGYDLSWLKYRKDLDPNKDKMGTAVVQVFDDSQAALAETKTTDLENMSVDKLEGVHSVCVNYYQHFDLVANDEEEAAFNKKCSEVSDLLYASETSAALKFEEAGDEFGVVYSALEIEGGGIPEVGAVWGKATIEMTEIQQGIAGAIDVVGGIVQGVTNRVLCLAELGIRVLPEVSQGLLDDYGPDSAEGACKLSCVTTVSLPAALWCMAYPENFGNNSEFDPDTLWQEIDSYLHATCDDITAQNGCVY